MGPLSARALPTSGRASPPAPRPGTAAPGLPPLLTPRQPRADTRFAGPRRSLGRSLDGLRRPAADATASLPCTGWSPAMTRGKQVVPVPAQRRPHGIENTRDIPLSSPLGGACGGIGRPSRPMGGEGPGQGERGCMPTGWMRKDRVAARWRLRGQDIPSASLHNALWTLAEAVSAQAPVAGASVVRHRAAALPRQPLKGPPAAKGRRDWIDIGVA